MATILAAASGNWSAGATWTGGTPPAAGDIAVANTYTVTVDQSVTCTEVHNDTTGGATGGGYFDLLNGVTLTANIISGAVAGQCVRFNLASPNTASVVGNVTGGAGSHGVLHSGTGTLTISGAITTGAGNGVYGIYISSTGTLNHTGTVTGGSGTNSIGIFNAVAGNVNVTGNIIGGSSTTNSYAIKNNGSGIVIVSGSATAGATSYALINLSTGTARVVTAIGANGLPAINGVSSSGVTTFEQLQYGASGSPPTYGYCKLYTSAVNPQCQITLSDASTKILYPLDRTGVLPAASNVKSGVVYGVGTVTGTLVTTKLGGTVSMAVPFV